MGGDKCVRDVDAVRVGEVMLDDLSWEEGWAVRDSTRDVGVVTGIACSLSGRGIGKHLNFNFIIEAMRSDQERREAQVIVVDDVVERCHGAGGWGRVWSRAVLVDTDVVLLSIAAAAADVLLVWRQIIESIPCHWTEVKCRVVTFPVPGVRLTAREIAVMDPITTRAAVIRRMELVHRVMATPPSPRSSRRR